ncbi:hypothetical protein [Brevundimonas sp. Root1279]|uniref:hypothetical protein n=1 Tax=Brevundimonas sp. Root1279 TaxID=1736443 RepID=UPI0006F85D1F|nr:hypothetical protein [Brevundimonas sp. Root1279]KQW82233.1 hypothetical protein ASC65_08105 [Brevundimonas sp. Root1279]
MRTEVVRTIALLAILAATSAATSSFAQDPECYDAEVSARIVSQTPTVMPGCDDCIIMRWPWILDLDVRRVHSGEVARGRMTVLTFQHTDFRRDLGSVRWKLRRNTLGGFNAVRAYSDDPERLCSTDEPPTTAYVTPPDGQSIEDLRREGREYYSRDD